MISPKNIIGTLQRPESIGKNSTKTKKGVTLFNQIVTVNFLNTAGSQWIIQAYALNHWQFFFDRCKNMEVDTILFLQSGSLVGVIGDEIVCSSETTDDLLSDKLFLPNGVKISTQSTMTYVTFDGQYIFKYNAENPSLCCLANNVINSNDYLDYCKSDNVPNVQTCYPSLLEYCTSNPDDPRCFCNAPPEIILATLFNVEQLRRNPALYQQMILEAPCLAAACTKEIMSEKTSVSGNRLLSLYDGCNQSVTICSNILDIQGEINADVVTADCGSNSIDCGACPIGTACDKNSGFCSKVCTQDSNCQGEFGTACVDGVCTTSTSGNNGGLSTGALIGIIVGVAVFIILTVTLVVLKKQGKLGGSKKKTK